MWLWTGVVQKWSDTEGNGIVEDPRDSLTMPSRGRVSTWRNMNGRKVTDGLDR